MRASLVSCYFGLLLVCLAAPARTDNQGLIVLDGSLTGGAGWGEAVPSGVDPSVGSDDGIPDYLITPELGKLRGDNLFLSFLRFGVGVDEIAQFTDAGVRIWQANKQNEIPKFNVLLKFTLFCKMFLVN